MEKFTVKFYTEDEHPTIKGNGFDGLIIGTDREEAERFISFVNSLIKETPEPKPPRVFVIAGNVAEYSKYCRDNKVGPPTYMYLYNVDQLRGLQFIQTLHIGSYNKRPDYAAIKNYLMAFNGIVEPTKGG